MRYQLRHVRVVTNNLPGRISSEQGGRCCAVENSSRLSSDSSNRGDSVGGVSREKHDGSAEFSQYFARHALECVDLWAHPEVLESGWWVVVGEAGGQLRGWRFAQVERRPFVTRKAPGPAAPWNGPPATAWSSSLTAKQYCAAVEELQELIAAGSLKQCNLTRVLSAPWPARNGKESGESERAGGEPDAAALFELLKSQHPAPFSGYVHVPGGGAVAPIWLVSASPELFLRRDGVQITATPIKGTAPSAEQLEPKDDIESRFVAGEVAAEFARVCTPVSVEISAPRIEAHPGLVQLVRTVSGELEPARTCAPWEAIFTHLFPPASVVGFPRPAADAAIRRLEKTARGPYCGVFGWIDGDRQQAELAVTIRSFWWAQNQLHFGTGAGITADSKPRAEWEETELKAAQLLRLASTVAAAPKTAPTTTGSQP